VDIQWMQTLYTSLVILGAAAVHGITGFGLAQVAMGIMPLFRSPQSASVIFSMVAVVANFRVWWSVRDDFNWRDWIVPVIGLAFGLPIGIYFFKQWDEQTLRIAIGITLGLAVIIIASMKQLDSVQKWLEGRDIDPGWPTAVIAGFLAGALGGAVAIPGPPMILYGTFMLAAGLWESGRMKATFTAFFGTLMLYRVASVIYTGDATAPLAIEAAIAVPALLLGAWAGIWIYERIPRNIFNWIVLAMLTINAGILLYDGFTGGSGDSGSQKQSQQQHTGTRSDASPPGGEARLVVAQHSRMRAIPLSVAPAYAVLADAHAHGGAYDNAQVRRPDYRPTERQPRLSRPAPGAFLEWGRGDLCTGGGISAHQAHR